MYNMYIICQKGVEEIARNSKYDYGLFACLGLSNNRPRRRCHPRQISPNEWRKIGG